MALLGAFIMFLCLLLMAWLAKSKWPTSIIRVILPMLVCFLSFVYLVLQGLKHVTGEAIALQDSACRLPLVSAWLSCSTTVSEPLPTAAHEVSVVISDPVVACNIFGGSLSLPNAISDYMPSIAFTDNLATNITLWTPSSPPIKLASKSVKGLIPELKQVSTGLSRLLGQSQGTYELSDATLSHWTAVIYRESSCGRLSTTFYRVLGQFHSLPVPRLARDRFDGLHGSLRLLDRSIRDTSQSVDNHSERVASLLEAFSAISQMARREEWFMSNTGIQVWFPKIVVESSQAELRRQVRLHSSYATCALEYALDALRQLSAALITLQQVSDYVDSDAIADVLISLQTLQLRSAALDEANTGLQRMIR
ncbi:hypothetical protein AURDEDRAFT_137409 [Auricularia subglabra TFB-10046 SS5]|uniref:Uncharacterized protein n=1 Tax=Auricularia subglabra (strain TFB-10046 / SS5) TaxID=717982 RepID=J0WYY1_AURST|nr:hypothetical protein AURDEDRAFT_137409 [Auricularia subglabra TFB-10046 SS5]